MTLPKVYSPNVQRLLNTPTFKARIKRPIKVVSKYDIPYLAGYSKDGRTVFFDRHFMPFLKYHGRTFDTRKFIMLHEVGEKSLIDIFHLRYQAAHHIITHVEFEIVKAAGLPWRVYDRFLKPQIKGIYHDKLQNLPPNLDITPYRDEKEKKILAALVANHDIREKTVKISPRYGRHRH